ncbi:MULTISPECIES: NAD(P)/FAD-dependent oxidoreductase [unclassified Bacillus (in: firmicutes)]|uniref:flavin-containing monooxygenase n=1 Tax=unclassified Bacillus (in: firmicutes) TaxID=185979 RepID=UPI0008E98AF6|nr:MULTISPECIES: NAD(P)/FAD-dependent oxidoreductase [unclassified Bacillus (in: firmicutes)]SFI81289.1 putative flavoprotein involved in K+ transport [Bacillus sp. 71mf]SFS84957.1 putative flavoprotein involved in K+ transport [Bacillus sp. 103mf]
MLDVVVIGAGQAGLSMGYYLKQGGYDFVILDGEKRIGDSWRNRYDSLVLFTPKSYSSLPGMKLEGDENAFPTKDEIADYLETYANRFLLPVQMEITVHKVQKVKSTFEVSTDKGVFHSKHVIIASGAFQKPFIPSISQSLSQEVFQIHSSQYQSLETIPDGPVLVVGGGNSGTQIATELAESRDVTIAISHPLKFLPLKIMGKSIFHWLEKMGFLYAGTTTKRGSWFQKQSDPIFGFEFKKMIRKGKIEIHSRVIQAQGGEITFNDRSKINVHNIIWSTGFVPHYKWIDIEGILDEKGFPLHKRGVSPIQGLYYIGLPWQYQRGSALICGVGRDAEFLYSIIQGT